jgi:2-(1,2-epoxy-1,2-dihydrophenyl)acetyl-CoA isomerase
MDSILFDRRGGVAILTLNRPEVFNSFNKDMAILLQDYLDQCGADPDIRCVYITGNGKAFCAGQDLKEVVDPEGPELSSIVRDHYNPIIMRIKNLEKPVVCGVNGVAAGAGANIALACDVVVAKKSASFIQAFSKIGLIPDSGGTFTLPRLVGWQKASALIMLGDKVAAEEAERIGMIYKVLEDDLFDTEMNAMCDVLAAMPTRGLALSKKALNSSAYQELSEQLDTEELLQTIAGGTYDYHEGVSAFLEKRKPEFKGE